MTQPPPKKNSPASDAFAAKLGSALVDLSDSPAWKKYCECEATLVADLQDLATSVSVAETNYPERLIFMAGMVQGIKRMILRRRDVLEEYKKKKEEGVTNAGRNTSDHNTTYGHTAGGG